MISLKESRRKPKTKNTMNKYRHILSMLFCTSAIATLLSCVACTAGTGVAYSQTTETLNTEGDVISREKVEVERRSRAVNTKVSLSDLDSTLTYSLTNGLASGLSTSSFEGSPETQLFKSIESLGYLYRNMQPPTNADQSERLDRLERLIESSVGRSTSPPIETGSGGLTLSDRDEALIRYFRELDSRRAPQPSGEPEPTALE